MKELCEAAYCSEWYNLNVKEKKMFLMLLMQLQVKVNNNAYGLVELNLEAFGKVNLAICKYFA